MSSRNEKVGSQERGDVYAQGTGKSVILVEHNSIKKGQISS